MSKEEHRKNRDRACQTLNALATEAGAERLGYRPAGEAVAELYQKLCEALPRESIPRLREARALWCNNGGAGELDEELLTHAPEAGDADSDGEEQVPGHHQLKATRATAFRLRARAFMLTFNALSLVASPAMWAAFQEWVEGRKEQFHATYWSATLEISLHAETQHQRVHAHCYFSWHGKSGVDHSTTDAWMFQGIRPRVDANTEARSPWQWLKATQHGHFYVAVDKLGTLYTATNYPAWGGIWVPDAQWVVSLWRQHKLDHEGFMALSVKLRDGHDRRKAVADAVRSSETKATMAVEKEVARQLIALKAKPFKPLPDRVQESTGVSQNCCFSLTDYAMYVFAYVFDCISACIGYCCLFLCALVPNNRFCEPRSSWASSRKLRRGTKCSCSLARPAQGSHGLPGPCMALRAQWWLMCSMQSTLI